MDEQSQLSLSAEIKSANDVISKLKKFTEALDKTNNDNILTHLCDGLETFLGFDPSSKGYDGTGIVYSDLDRLCDAVMGFLSGVLEAVKNENEVITYDNKDTESNLSSVLKKLQSSIGSGRDGLAASVDAVREWLEKYNSKVETLTTAVTTKLGKLSTKLSSGADTYYQEVTDKASSPLATQLSGWTKTVKKIQGEVETINSNVKVLDSKLRDSVMHEMNVVDKAVKMLADSAEVPGLREQVGRVDAELDARRDKLEAIIIRKSDSILLTLVEQRQTILEKINHESESLGIKINDEWQNIAKEVNTLDDVQHDMFKKINDAVRKTKEDAFSLVGDYTGTYKKPTIKHFTNIIGEMPDINATNKFAGAVEGNSKLYQDVKRIQTGIDEMEKQLQVGAGKIGEAISTAVSSVNRALTDLDSKLQSDLEQLKGKINQQLESAITALRNGVGNAATEDGRQGVNYFIQALKNSRLKSLPQLKAWITAADETQLENALGGFFFGMFKTNIQDLLNITANVNSLGSKQTKLLDAITKDLQDKVNEKINDIKDRSKFNANMPEYYNWVNTNGSEGNRTLFYSIGDVKNNIKEYFTGNIDNNAGFDFAKLGDYIRKKKIATRTVSEVLHRITKLQALHKSVYDKRDATDQLMVKLEEALNAIKADVESIESTVVEASNALERSIGVVHHALIRTEQVTREAISEVSNRVANAVKEAFAEVESTVDSYRDNLLEQLESSFSHLTSAVRTLFAEQKKADLQALKGVVEEQKEKIKKIIEEDKRSGIKGLLKAVNGIKVTGETADGPTFERTDTLLNAIKDLAPMKPPTAEKFKQLSEKFYAYYNNVNTYIKDQVTDKTKGTTKQPTSPSPTNPSTDPASKLTKIKGDFDKLLNHLSASNDSRKYNYDNDFAKLRDSLSTSLASLSPSHFANPRHPELLDAVKKGLQGFVKELGRVYVNKYEGAKYVDWKENESNDGQNCAKIFLTLIDLLDRDFITLGERCNGSWTSEQIDKSTKLGELFQSYGYVVANKGKQNGELRNKPDFKGQQIMNTISGSGKLYNNFNSMVPTDPVKNLFARLHDYRRVCHLKYNPKAKAPTTVYQMLLWLTGLEWNNMFTKINGYIPTWFNDLTAEYKLVGNRLEVAIPESKGFCTIQNVDAKSMAGLYNNVTIYTDKVLIALLGHGHSGGRYACDFYTNADSLLYPSSASACLDMFVEICLRLNHQLRFLYKQCQNGVQTYGWRDCHYGKGIAGSAWNCNNIQCPEQECDQIADQSCKQHYKCGVKSPLQSFLEDGLQGFLPHQFSSPSCKLTCSVRDHRGITCITPMGFNDIGIAASHTKTGEHLKDVLHKFCGKTEYSLSMFCAYTLILTRRPPQTLGDMFSFYHHFLANWEGQGGKHKEKAFRQAVNGAIFGREYTGLNPESIQVSKTHDEGKHAEGDLFGLLSCDPDSKANLPCGQYLQPLSLDALCTFTDKHAVQYLSWIMYMTETFYDLLAQLWNQCCRNCDKPGSRCHDRRCSKKCPVKYSSNDGKSTVPSEQEKHTTDCNSIVKCQSTHPTIYKYGFTFGSPYRLSGAKNYDQQKRTCKDFCEALERVLAKDSLLVELIRSIDEFLWKIREYFTYTVVALWSASFLYLLYVYIGRLDTLHIRSHLRTPASHRIAAQSLLAAARVGRLSKIAYLQP